MHNHMPRTGCSLSAAGGKIDEAGGVPPLENGKDPQSNNYDKVTPPKREGDPVRTPICVQCALLNQHPVRTLFASSAHSSHLHPLGTPARMQGLGVWGLGFREGLGFRV